MGGRKKPTPPKSVRFYILDCGDIPGFDVSADQTRESRTGLEVFLKKSGVQLWIQYSTDNAKRKKAPQYCE